MNHADAIVSFLFFFFGEVGVVAIGILMHDVLLPSAIVGVNCAQLQRKRASSPKKPARFGLRKHDSGTFARSRDRDAK